MIEINDFALLLTFHLTFKLSEFAPLRIKLRGVIKILIHLPVTYSVVESSDGSESVSLRRGSG